ncbi:MAG: TIM barrel protein [Sumerlaeia bacterium]
MLSSWIAIPGTDAMPLRFAYRTCACALHRLEDALELIAEADYDGVCLCVDFPHFDPFADHFEGRARALAMRLETLGLALVIEARQRFLLNPAAPFEPTLISAESPGRSTAQRYLARCLKLAALIRAEGVRVASGVVPPGMPPEEARVLLAENFETMMAAARRGRIKVSVMPEAGALIDSVEQWKWLEKAARGHSLAFDVALAHATDEHAPEETICELAPRIGSVTLADSLHGNPEALPPGQGGADLVAVLAALEEIGFGGLVCVGLSSQSETAHRAIPETLRMLKSLQRRSDQ